MTAIDPATCWVPVPVRWRYVQPGDVFAGAAGLFWVESASYGAGTVCAYVIGSNTGPKAKAYILDPDELVSILVPVPERDARSLVLEDLATHVIGRRTVGAA